MSTLADRIKMALAFRRMSQADLAREIDIAQPSVNNWATGETKSLRAEVAVKAAKALGVRVEWLVFGSGPMLDESGGIEHVPSISAALPVVLDAIAACPHRDELRTLLALLVDHDAPAYRQRLAELLSLPPPSIAKGLIETGDFAGPAPSHDNHDPDSQHHSRKREPSR